MSAGFKMGIFAVGGVNPDEVMEKTWGHLNPKPNTIYKGTIDIACDDGSEYLVTSHRLISNDGEFICDGPQWYEQSNDFACEVMLNKEAGFYRFDIEYTRKGIRGSHITIKHREKIG